MPKQKSSSRTTRAFYWIFTINKPHKHKAGHQKPTSWLAKRGIRYMVWQAEIGACGTEHLQGYVAFTQQLRFAEVKKLCKRAHWESRKGSHSQAKEYCTKDDTREAGPWTYGSDEGI